MSFISTFYNAPYILTEGAIVQRLKSEFNLNLDNHIVHAGLIYEKKTADVLASIYRQYIDTAIKYKLPIMLMTPTRRANKERINNSVHNEQNVIVDCVEFLSNIRNKYQDYKHNIFIGGLMGCKGDAYKFEDSLSSEESYNFHVWQADQFKTVAADYLFAGIMPALPEAIGMAKAMEQTRLPYIISFMVRDNGMLLDETSISNAIKTIDEVTMTKPLCYMANCIHPANLNSALSYSLNKSTYVVERFAGIQANASTLSPEELDNNSELKADEPQQLAASIDSLHMHKQIKIWGGCCGTNNQHIEEFAKKMITWK